MFGTIKPPNTSTESLSEPPSNQPNSKLNLVYAIETELSNIPSQLILNLCTKIYPVQQQSTNVYSSLYKTLLGYFTLQLGKKINYWNIVQDVTRISNGINQQLCTKITTLLKRQDIKSRLLDNIYKSNPNLANTFAPPNSNSSSLASSTHHLILDSKKPISAGQSTNLLETIGNKYQNETNTNKYVNLLSKQLNDGFRRQSPAHTNQDFSAAIAEKYMRQRTLVQNLVNKMEFQKQLTQMEKIIKKCVICQNALIIGDLNEGNINRHTFKCKDCGEYFHKKCMPRDNNCSFCQLKNINPLQKVKTQLFLGILKKGTKKHELQFQITKSHISGDNQTSTDSSNKKNNKISNSMMPSVQIRCIRLKQYNDSVSNFINLFPDACTIMVNNRLIKQFQPLHKQSSLKYRRDQCIKITTNVSQGTNKITITQRIAKKDVKCEQRIQPENHLVGVCITQNIQTPKQHTKLEQFLAKQGFLNGNNLNAVESFLANLGCKMSQFSQSQDMLKSSLFIGNKKDGQKIIDDEEIVCDSIKVPLVCSLTLQKMKYPGRTIFCKHFNSFDIYNFILLNAQAKLPKWQCPICKASAYSFKIDCILHSIVGELQKLKQNKKLTSSQHIKQTQQATQVEIDKDMNLKLLNSQGNILISKKSKITKDKNQQYLETQFYPYWINNIYDLAIDGKQKRFKQQPQQQNKKTNKMTSEEILKDQSGKSGKKKDKNKDKQHIKQKEGSKISEKQMKKAVRSADQIQCAESPFLIVHRNKSQRKQSNKKSRSQISSNVGNKEPMNQKKAMDFEIIMEPFTRDLKQQNNKETTQKQHEMIEQNKLELASNNLGKEIGLGEKSTIINQEDIKQKQQKSEQRKQLSGLPQNQVLQARQQIKRLNLHDDSSENMLNHKNMENQIISENMMKRPINEEPVQNNIDHQKQIQEQEVVNQQRKVDCPVSQSKSDKMSQQDPDIERAIRQCEERYFKAVQSSPNIPKVIHAKKFANSIQNKNKSQQQQGQATKNIIGQSVLYKPAQEIQERVQISSQGNKEQKQIEDQPFQSSYRSVDFEEPNKSPNYKVQIVAEKINSSNPMPNLNYGDICDDKDLMIKEIKQLDIQNNNQKDPFEPQNGQQIFQMLQQCQKQKTEQQKRADKNLTNQIVDQQQYQMNLSFLSPHHQSHIENKIDKKNVTPPSKSSHQTSNLNLFQNFKLKEDFQLKGKQKKLPANSTRKKQRKNMPVPQKIKSKSKSKGGVFNIPEDADVIQLSD